MNKNDIKNRRRPARRKKENNFREWVVKTSNITLFAFLEEVYPSLSRNNIKHLLSSHRVSIHGAMVSQFDFILNKGDSVIVFQDPIKRSGSKNKLPIIYEDDELIAIDKPSTLLSVSSDKEKRNTAYRLVMDYVQSKDRHTRIYVVHRIDEDTSGVLLFVKNEKLARELQDNWQSLVKKRGYYAVVEGKMEKSTGTYVDYLKENKLNLMYVTDDKKYGKLCKTSYEVIRESEKYSLLDISIDSGRKNQIRVQLGYRNHHVLGDDKYGEPANPLNRLALHAYELSLLHPQTKKLMKFRSKMPKEFMALFDENKK